MMKKTILAVALFAASAVAFAGSTATFNVNGGYGSSVSLSGGSMAESGQYGNGASSQYSTSSGYGVAAGGTGMAAGAGYGIGGNFAGAGAAAGSVSGAYGTSGTYSYSAGATTGNGYGDSKGGAGVDFSGYGYGNLNGSYTYSN